LTISNEQTAIVSSSAVENLLPLTHHPSPINEKQITLNHPTIQQSNHPTIQPSNHPTIQPSNNPFTFYPSTIGQITNNRIIHPFDSAQGPCFQPSNHPIIQQSFHPSPKPPSTQTPHPSIQKGHPSIDGQKARQNSRICPEFLIIKKQYTMKKIFFSMLAVALFWSCGKDDGPDTPPASSKPTITDFTPKSGPEGTEVTITGTNFSTTKAENTVKFGTMAATVGTATATQLKVTVPTGATTGKISVSVDGEAATSTADFTVTALVPENSAPEMADQEFAAKEDITDANEIGQVEATDADGDTLTFTITENDNDLFMVSDTGMLTLAEGKTLDYETATSHSITVSVSDGEDTAEAKIAILVENVIESLAEDPASFVTTWKTEEDAEKIRIRVRDDLEYDFTVDWGDGTVEDMIFMGEIFFEHIYQNAGIYTVAIEGSFPGFTLNQALFADGDKILSVEQWGNIEWKRLDGAFKFCLNMVYNATDVPDLSHVTDLSGMFSEADAFNGDVSGWDTSNVTNMYGMFDGATSFNRDISGWDTSNVTTMENMFDGATSFNGDISGWDTSNVTTMENMFRGATSFNGDISGWDTSNVTNMYDMFAEATSFNGDISGWDTSSVTNMKKMLYNTTSFDQDLGGWDIGNVETMSNMFDNSGMSKENLNATIIGWHGFVEQNNKPTGITLGLEGMTICGTDAIVAANGLEIGNDWIFTGNYSVELECN
jgi:surface protein